MLKILIVHGGLGNQMFAYACRCELKRRFLFSFVSLDMLEPWDVHNGYELMKVFGQIKSRSYRFYRRQLKFYSQHFTKRFFELINEEEKDYCSYNSDYFKKKHCFQLYDGFWQSEHYFKNSEKLIRKRFSFDISKLNEKSIDLFQKIVKDRFSVSVHLRRGDYLEYQHYFGGICTNDYYNKSISFFQRKNPQSTFYFFSDDIDWVREEFGDLNGVYVDFNIGDDSWQDMYLMSICKNNIIANSSFSWWGAWLNINPDKVVVAPKKWFKDIPASDIIPESWIRI